MNDQSRRILIVLLLVFPVALVELLVFRNTVRETLVIPLLYLLWLGNLIFNSIHQMVFWGFLLFLVIILLFRSLQRKPRSTPIIDRTTKKEQEKSRRVAYWAGQIRRNADRSFRDAYSLSEFRKLIISVWAYRANVSPREIERAIKTGELELPPEIRLYFQNNNRSRTPDKKTLKRALYRVRSFFRRDDSKATSSFEQRLHPMIQSLETQLEVKRDHRDHSSR